MNITTSQLKSFELLMNRLDIAKISTKEAIKKERILHELVVKRAKFLGIKK